MKKTDVINELAAVTGENTETCEVVLKGFEKVSEEVLKDKLRGITHTTAEISQMVSDGTGVEEAICRTIVTELSTTIEFSLKDKLNIFKK